MAQSESWRKSDRKESRKFSLSDVILSAFKPGVNHSVLMFINIVFLLLLLTLILIIAFLTGYKLYMIILVMIAFGLFIGFNKFVANLMEGTPEGEIEDDDKKK